MQIATVLVCSFCQRVAVSFGGGSWKHVIDENDTLERVIFTTVVLCWQCGQTQSTSRIRGIGCLMTDHLLAMSPALEIIESSFAPNTKEKFWLAYVGDPPRENVIAAATPPPLRLTLLPVVGLDRIEEGFTSEYQFTFYDDRGNNVDCEDFFEPKYYCCRCLKEMADLRQHI